MEVELSVKLFASLREGRFDERTMSFPEGTSPRGVIESLGLGPGAVAVVFVNSRHAELDRPLRQGDVLALFPPVGGG